MKSRATPFEQGFGRVIYLTLIRRLSNAQVQQRGWTSDLIDSLTNDTENVTICFDPQRDTNLNTRIDFYVKHLGDAGIGNNGYYATANIDVWNIGPALEQFLSAYGAYESEGHFKDVNTKKYAIVLQVGFKNGGERQTVFAGHISSFVLERQQTNTTVDNVWHFMCQYPDPQQNDTVGDSRVAVKSGETYDGPEWNANQTFVSWEEYLKTAICYHKRTVYTLKPAKLEQSIASFSVPRVIEDDVAQMSRIVNDEIEIPMVPTPQSIHLARKDFNKWFAIEYRVSRNSVELPTVKKLWQQRVPISSWNLDVSSLQATVTSIARGLNCHARIELDENTGKQTFYIYPAGWAEQVIHTGPADYTFIDYQNLRNPPRVSANMFHLDMVMEPAMRPGSIIELQISEGFMGKYKHPTFEPAFSMANAATVFAGANFIGLANMSQEEKKKNAIASAGNIFNTKFVATIVEHRGSSHTAEWTTSVDCYGIVVKGKETTL